MIHRCHQNFGKIFIKGKDYYEGSYGQRYRDSSVVYLIGEDRSYYVFTMEEEEFISISDLPFIDGKYQDHFMNMGEWRENNLNNLIDG